MSASGFELSNLQDARLALLATSQLPAWLWSTDATRIVWANPIGAAIFGASTSAAISSRKFDAAHPAAAQIAGLATTLERDAPPRLERLCGFGAELGRALTCACSHIVLRDGTPAVLVVATERAGPELTSSPERRAPMERRHPLRFVWQLDEEGGFTLGSDEFIELMGARTAAMIGKPWAEMAAGLALDPEGRIARAIATHDTWSGLTVSWPVDDGKDRLPVELSGLPVFDRERIFRGYRGFGVCRDFARLTALAIARRASMPFSEQPPAQAPASVPEERQVAALDVPGENIVPFPSSAAEVTAPALTAVEQMAFRELSRKLTQGLAAAGVEPDVRIETAPNSKPEPLPGEMQAEIAELKAQWKQTEQELIEAKRRAETASSAKSDFLAKISHEIRTPLNSIIGFSEVMMAEQFGPIGNERYREYLKDIHASGGHLLSLINDLLDLSKIEAGKLQLTFASVALNDLTQQCVAIMQPQANRERIIIRTALAPALPQVVADARSVRQIVLNLLSNSLKFTAAGGQVIVSTALNDDGEVVLRVRDTGVGMTEKDIVTALEPFRQLATSPRGGTGLGLPLTKAMAEANRAKFHLSSTPKVGTLVEITFPASSIPAG